MNYETMIVYINIITIMLLVNGVDGEIHNY